MSVTSLASLCPLPTASKCLLSRSVGPRGMEGASGTDAVTPRAAAPNRTPLGGHGAAPDCSRDRRLDYS